MEIMKRDNFYYLTYSFRKRGKVINRKKYLGTEIPKNVEEIKQKFLEQCFKEDLFIKLKRIKKAYGEEWKQLPESIKKQRLIDFSIDFTYNSNAIEGSTITKEETENIIIRKIAPNKPLSDVQETIRHSQVFFETIQEKKEFSESILKEWHEKLFKETKADIAKKYREYLVRVGNYRAPDWQDVPKLMKQFIAYYNKQKKIMHPVELAAFLHYDFEKVHPFGDGNGRVGRLLINYILYKNQYPLIHIEMKKRSAYYRALEKGRIGFVQYFMRYYMRKYKEYI